MLFQGEPPLYFQVELSSPGLYKPQEAAVVLQAAPQQDQASFQVVFEVGQLQAGIPANFLVRKVRSPGTAVVAHEFPKDAPGDALDQIVVVDKNAVIGCVVLDDGSGRRLHRLAT